MVLTQDLIWLSEIERDSILVHKFPILLSTFATHCGNGLKITTLGWRVSEVELLLQLGWHCGNFFLSALQLGLGASSEALAFTFKLPMHVYLRLT